MSEATNTARLAPLMQEARNKITMGIAEMAAEGHTVSVGSGYRSYAEQNHLYEQGRTIPGKIVTKAKAGYSWHNFGLAADLYVIADGEIVPYPEPATKRLVEIMKAQGLEWGGDWPSFPDYPHFQLTGGATLAELRETFEKFGDNTAECWDLVRKQLTA